MRSSRRTAAAVVTCVAAMVSMAGCSPSTGTAPGDGPLQVAEAPHGWALAVPPGEVWTDGMETLRFDTVEDVTIDAIGLVTDGPGLELVDARLAGDDRTHGSTQFHPSFPPEDGSLGPLIPAIGATVEPSPGPAMGSWQLLLGLRLTGSQRVVRRGITIDYSVEGVAYREILPAMLAVCPGDTRGPDCEQPSPEDVATTEG